MKRLICVGDIDDLVKQGEKTLYVDCDTIVTALAKDAAISGGIEIKEKTCGCDDKVPAQADGGIDRDLIYNALKAMVDKGMLSGLFDPNTCSDQKPYEAERHCCGFKLVRGHTAKLEVLDTGNPSDKVFYQELIGSDDNSSMNAGFMTIERCNFDWDVECEEIYYIIDGTLTITIDGKIFTANPGDSLYAPKGSKVAWGSPGKVKVFYATY